MKRFLGIWMNYIKEFVFKRPKKIVDIYSAILSIIKDTILEDKEYLITQEEFINKIEKSKKDKIEKLLIKSIANKKWAQNKQNINEIASILLEEYNRIVKLAVNDIGRVRSKIIN